MYALSRVWLILSVLAFSSYARAEVFSQLSLNYEEEKVENEVAEAQLTRQTSYRRDRV